MDKVWIACIHIVFIAYTYSLYCTYTHTGSLDCIYIVKITYTYNLDSIHSL